MTLKKYPFQKKDLLYGAFITGTCAIIVLLLALLGINLKVFDPVGKAIDSFQLSDGFFYAKSAGKEMKAKTNHGIVLVDIKDCNSREEIADVIDKINEGAPRLVALDIIFGKASTIAPEADSALVRALRQSPRLILAKRFVPDAQGGRFERSFMADQIACIEGDVNYDYGIVRRFAPEMVVDGVEHPSFVAQIAKQGGICDSFQAQLINYSPIRFITVRPDELPCNDFLKDQIVIVGDRNDLRDLHDIPVLMEGQPRTAGVNIALQCLYTLAPGNGFVTCRSWLSLLIGLVLTYLFVAFVVSPLFRTIAYEGLIIFGVQMLALFITIGISYFLFWKFHVYVSLTYWFMGLAFSEVSGELVFAILKKIGKE